MQSRKADSPKLFLLSLFMHVIVLLILVMSYELSSKMAVLENSDKDMQIINASVVPVPLKKEVPKPEPVRSMPVPQEAPVLPPVPKEVIAIPNKKVLQEKAAQQLLADLKKQAIQKKRHDKKVAEKLAKHMKELAEKALQQQMQQESQRLAGMRAAQIRGEVDKYKALILQVISQYWLVPGAVDKKLFAELLIRLAPGGAVLDVQVIKSSGNEALDRSAEAAVFKASPLPVPNDSGAFERFRQFVLKVRPVNLS